MVSDNLDMFDEDLSCRFLGAFACIRYVACVVACELKPVHTLVVDCRVV